MRISDWSSDVCSSDLPAPRPLSWSETVCARGSNFRLARLFSSSRAPVEYLIDQTECLGFIGLKEGIAIHGGLNPFEGLTSVLCVKSVHAAANAQDFLGLNLNVRRHALRSEEHTSELQSLMRISYAVFCL